MTDPKVKPDATRVAIKRLATNKIGPRREGVSQMSPESSQHKMYEGSADMIPIVSTMRRLKEGDYKGAALDAAMGGIPAGGMLKKMRAIAKEYGLTTKMVSGRLFVGTPYTRLVEGHIPTEMGQGWSRVDSPKDLISFIDGEEIPIQHAEQTGEMLKSVTQGSEIPRTMESEIAKAGREAQTTFRPDSAIVSMAKKMRKEPEQDLTARMKQMLERLQGGEELKDIKPKRKLPTPRSHREFREDIKGVEGTSLKKKK
jgi:hypothetical protein